MKKRILALFYVIFCFLLVGCNDPEIELSNLEDYELYLSYTTDSELFMPKLEEIENYESMEVLYFRKYKGSHSINLIVTFTAENYEIHKQNIFENYFFWTEVPMDRTGEKDIPKIEFQYNEYLVRVSRVDNKLPTLQYLGMIGFSDEQYKISYMYFHDGSLDFVPDKGTGNEMQEFLDRYFRFESTINLEEIL